ncbi:hypothetical protein V2J09_014600 [Rumex salicifolius]
MSASADVVLTPISENTMQALSGCFNGRLDMRSNESILVYLTIGGSMIPLRVLESDSIASVKLKIQKFKGFVVKKQKLVFGGRELARNNCLIKDYGITGGNCLHLVLKSSDHLVINVFEIQIDRYRNIGYLKKRIFNLFQNDQDLLFKGEKLEVKRLIDDIFKNCDSVVHLVARKSAKYMKIEIDITPIIVNPKVTLSSVLCDLGDSKFYGLANGRNPIQSSEGTGRAYIMSDVTGQKYVSIFKPTDEEPMAVNNPRGLPESLDGEGLKRGTRVGEGAIREVAAYLLDHPETGPRYLTGELMGFSGVPPTIMVKCLHKGFHHPEGFEGGERSMKFGSLQMFMENDGSCEEMGPQDFPIEEVHKISVLDIRFDWLFWPQARQPYSPKAVKYIFSLDSEADIALLKFNGWNIVRETQESVLHNNMSEAGFLEVVSDVMDRELDKKMVVKRKEEEITQISPKERKSKNNFPAIVDLELWKQS